MQVRFWGTRGSVPAPGPATVRYGGNTSCVEVQSGETRVILDCGTGARGLGAHLASLGGPLRAHLLLTHFHWDHIQGFPFFLPAFLPGSALEIYGVAGLEHGLEEALAGQMQYTYFPVRLDDLRSERLFREVAEQPFQVGAMEVQPHFLNHTCPALGYRLAAGGVSVAYMTDHEPFWPHRPELSLSDALVHPGDQGHVAFVSGLDLLIHDAQYTAEEYPARRGWGHSTIEYVVDVAVAAGVRRLALFHHEPTRDDAAMDQLVAGARLRARERGGELEVFAAIEGQVIELPSAAAATSARQPAPRIAPLTSARVALLGGTEQRRVLRSALVEDGYRLTEAAPDSPAEEWLALEPDLVLVSLPADATTPGAIGAISRSARPRPVIAVLDGEGAEQILAAVAEASTDVIVPPLSPPNLRARVRACVARLPASAGRASPDSDQAQPAAMDNLHIVDRLGSGELDSMLRTAASCGFRPGEILFRQGEPTGGVYYLHRGLVRIAVVAPDGREVTVGFAGPGDTVGEMSALDGADRSATALALEPVEASYVPRDLFRQTLERAPQTSARLLRLLVRRLRDVDARLARGEANGLRSSAQLGPEHLLQEPPEQQAAEQPTTDREPHERRQGAQSLRTIARLLGGARTPTALYRAAIKTLVRLVPSEAAGLYLLQQQHLVRVGEHGRSVPLGWHVRKAPASIAAALRSGRPRLTPSQSSDESGAEPGWSLVAPLVAQSRPLGVLCLRRSAPTSDEEVALTELVAATVAAITSPQRGNGKGAAPAAQLADLSSMLELEVHRARRLGYPVGVLVSRAEEDPPQAAGRDGMRRAWLLAQAVRRALRRTDLVTFGPFSGLTNGASLGLGIILPGLPPGHLPIVEARVEEAIRGARRGRRGAREMRVEVSSSVIYPEQAAPRQLVERALQVLGGSSSPTEAASDQKLRG